jgi:hypothetical protein
MLAPYFKKSGRREGATTRLPCILDLASGIGFEHDQLQRISVFKYLIIIFRKYIQ